MIGSFRVVIVAAFAAALSGTNVHAQNMIANGEFDTDVSGWTPYGVVMDWDPSDRHQSPNSGSGRITNDHDGSLSSGTVTCVNGLVGGQSYDLFGWLRVPTGQIGFGFASFGFYWREGVDCSGAQSWAGTTTTVSETDEWVGLTRFGDVAPPGTQSAEVAIFNSKQSPGTDPYLSYHDGIRFGALGAIFADGFESGSTNRWVTLF